MPDIPYLSEALRHIVNHPRQWDPGITICGDQASLDGRMVILAGATPVLASSSAVSHDMATLNGVTLPVQQMAANLAGLYRWEAEWLFAGHRTMPELVPEVNRLERGLALSTWSPDLTSSNGGVYLDDYGVIQVARHRATTYFRYSTGMRTKDHLSPEYARQYVTHVLSRLEPLIYHNAYSTEDAL